MKNFLAVFLGVFTLTVFSSCACADVEINVTNFPDENFRNYVSSKFDISDGVRDGVLSEAEIAKANIMDIGDKGITSLKGIEHFTALKGLDCHYNKLTELDVSNNVVLASLDCFGNKLTTLDVSHNTVLTKLICSGNQLTELDVSHNTALTELDCDDNQLTELDISHNTVLMKLYCGVNGYNQLTKLDVSNNTALRELQCSGNQLTELDVSHNTALTELYCVDNQLTELDVSNNTVLKVLHCYRNQLRELDVNNNIVLTKLYCGGNQLTELGISHNTALTELDCSYNQLTELNVRHNTALTILGCEGNQLTELDVSNNITLTRLVCGNNQLTALDLSNNTALINEYVSFEEQNIKGLIITSSDEALYPYKLDFSQYITSDKFTNVSFVLGNDSHYGNIATTYSGGIAYFASLPTYVFYNYKTGFKDKELQVEISGTISDTPDIPAIPDKPNTPNQPTTSGLPHATIQPVELSQDVLEKAASAVNIDVSQLLTLSLDSITAPKEPTQAMRDYAKNDNTELTGKLNTIDVNREGYYVFKVTLGDELWEKIKNSNISDYKFYGLYDSDAKVSSAFVNGLLGTWEILTMKGDKMTSFGVREFLMVAFLNAGTPFTMFLAKLIMSILGGGCNTGIIAGSFAVIVLLAVKFKKH